ncbi:MAG: NAD(P)-dependent oxidoreductase [Myxococcota bacterium]
MSPDALPREALPLVLITGACGLIGTRLARALIPDHRVVGLDIAPAPADFPSEASRIECDLTSEAGTDITIRRVVELHGPEIASVIHLAAYYDFSGAPSRLYGELTVRGTERLISALQRHARPQQLVFSSSLLVMRSTEIGDVIDEAGAVRAEWDYPRSKLDAEAVIEAMRGEMPSVILRLAGAYDEWGHSPPITQQIWRIREKKLESFFFPGNPHHGQSFVHLDDLVACLRRVVVRRDALEQRELFLVGEPEILSYAALQDRIGVELHGREWPTLRIPGALAKAGAWLKEKTAAEDDEPFIKPWMIDLADAHYPISIDRAKRRLDWEPGHRLADVLPAMIRNMKRDPARFDAVNGLPGHDGID